VADRPQRLSAPWRPCVGAGPRTRLGTGLRTPCVALALHSPPHSRCLLLAPLHARARVCHGREQSSLPLLCCTPQAKSRPQLRLPGHAAASRHRRSRPRVRRTSVAPPPPLQATASLLLSSAATAVPPPRATANPAMSAMASTSSPSIPCAFSPKPKATGVPRPSEPPPVSRCSAWPRLLGPPQDEPWPPTGARRPPLASPHLPRRRRGLLRPEQRAPTTSLFKFTTGTSYKNSTNIRGLTAEPMTHMNSVVKDLVAGNLLIFENA
jgi:hypothetical protein